MSDALVNLPTQFQASRNSLTGNLNGCVASTEGNNCLTGALGSVRSSVFRSRGIAASYSRQLGRLSAGIGAGYDRRKFIGAPGTVLADATGVIDETYYVAGYLAMEVGRAASLSANAYSTWNESGFVNTNGSQAYGASAAYSQQVYQGLSARGAIAIDHFDSDAAIDDITAASALLGLRYDF